MARREFQLVDGTSSKFWAIDLVGSAFTAQWGRIGTSGQAQKKEFSSDAAAKTEHDKLIAEKVRKGYAEVKSTGTSPAVVATVTATAKPAKKPKVAVEEDAPNTDAPVAASTVAPPIVVNLEIERHIDLQPQEWSVATWRKRVPLELPPPRPFDLQSRLADVARVPTNTYGWLWVWSAAEIPPSLTHEEAHFWLTAMCTAGKGDKTGGPPAVAQHLAGQTFKKIGLDEVRELIKSKHTSLTPEVLIPLMNLISIEQLVELMEEPGTRGRTHADTMFGQDPQVALGFQKLVLPYLTDEQITSLCKFIAPRIDITKWPTDHYSRPPASFFIAAMLGFSDALLPVVQQWKEGFYIASGWDHTHYHQPQIIVLGLGSAKVVESEMRRHKLPLNKAEYIRGWLATTEYAALDYIRDCILQITNREECEKLIKAFAIVHAPEAAPHMLELKLSSKAPKVAREWLENNVGHAIAGLIPVAAGRGKLADAAIDHLRDLRRAGHGDAIAKAAGKDVPERIRKEVLEHAEKSYVPFDAGTTPPAITEALASAPKPGKLPAWLPAHSIPMLNVGENRLNDTQLLALIATLQKAPLGTPGPLITAVKNLASRESRDSFSWRLFEMWQAEGAPSKDKWAMGAIGHLGGDGCVLKLTPLVRAWPGESQHQRAVFGLDCLSAMGTDAALMALNGISQKLKFKGLKTKAMEYMDAIALRRNMTRAQLEDRIVPDCDLDERGTRIFDFGPRQFRLVLGAEMKPMIKDADGKVKSDLPSPNAKDDAIKSKESVDTWKLLKKQVKEVAKVQAERLEQAMITGRRWIPDEFDTLLVKHPLMINLVRLAVWAAYDEQGKVLSSFRITEDKTLANEKDAEAELPKNTAGIGLIHPAHLSKESLGAWGEIFSDYEIIPPFEQLGRRVNVLEPGEKTETDFTRYATATVPAVTMVGILERLQWVRGIPQDAGIFYEHTKPFYGAGVTCVVQYEPGVGVGYMLESEDQKGITTFFIPGIYSPGSYPDHKNKLKLGEIDVVVVSEMIRDLIIIASKAK